MADFSAWARYKTIQVLDASVEEDLDDFPLLVAFDADPDIGAHARADGYDLRFALADGQTELAFERESFAIDGQGKATGRFWVRVPQLLSGGPGGVAAAIRCYYGNPNTADASDPSAVWGDNVYLLVSHLDDGATSAQVAAALGPTGAKRAAAEPAEDSSGMVNEAQAFDGTDDYVSFGTSVQPAGFLLEGWCRTTTKTNNVLASWTAADRCGINWSTTGKPILWRESANWRYWDAAAAALVGDGAWHHVAFVVPGNQAADINDAELLVDGAVQTVSATNSDGTPIAKTTLMLGNYATSGGMPYEDLLDELRIADPQSFPGATWTAKRDAIRAWLKFTHANMANAGHELVWGPATRPGGIGFHGAVAGGNFSTGAAAGGFHLSGAIAGSTR